MRSFGWSIGWVLVLGSAVPFAACAPERGGDAPPVLETEDVGPAFEEDLDLSTDRKGTARGPAGKLPGDFPEGLPVYKPSTISDMGQGERGSYVQFMSQDGAAKIRSWYQSALAGAGWKVESGPGGGLVATRGQRRARLSFETSGPVTLIRVDY